MPRRPHYSLKYGTAPTVEPCTTAQAKNWLKVEAGVTADDTLIDVLIQLARLKKGQTISHDRWGFQGQLVIANSDGTSEVEFGTKGEFTWASWSPDGRQISCLSLRGVEVVNLQTKKVIRKFPRQGMFQQLFWAPNGKWFCGTANVGGSRRYCRGRRRGPLR